jgi:hypothetical protein
MVKSGFTTYLRCVQGLASQAGKGRSLLFLLFMVIGIGTGNTIGFKKGNTVAHPCVWR